MKVLEIERGKEPVERDATPEEIENVQKVQAEMSEHFQKQEEKTKLRDAYVAEGWKDPFDLIDDILNNGIASVKQRRQKIKDELKKT